MDLSEYDFDLPEELIALRPVKPRPASRMLVAEGAGTAGAAPIDAHVHDLPSWLRPGDLLVFNDTRVIPAQLFGVRRRQDAEAAIDITLMRRLDPQRWEAMARPAKRLAPGDSIGFGAPGDPLRAEVETRDGARVRLRFAEAGSALDARIEQIGAMPLPPYIARRRPADSQDRTDYQPVLASRAGAVASPTASLHFDMDLLERLAKAGIDRRTLTLHVGPGTFLPVTAAKVDDHKMHAEWGEITEETAETINSTRAAGGRVIAVGTTVLRLLEAAAGPDGRVRAFQGETDIFIRPGVPIRAADGLITNFHLPRSTLIMLTAALMGLERMRAVYAHAVSSRYRFYSYGDTSLLLP